MNRSKQYLWIAAAVCALAAPALGRPIDERRPLAANGVVTVKNVNGSIAVQAWERREVEITGEITGDVEEVEIGGSESRLRIEVRYPENARNVHGEANLRIKVPGGAGVRVSAVNAPVTVSGVNGELELDTVNGTIEVTGQPASVDAKTVNGNIDVSGETSRVETATVGGRIELHGVKGDVAASSVGGTIRASGGDFERAKFASVSGPIEFDGGLGGNGTFEFESHSGDVVLHLPASVSAEFDVSTFSGHVDNDFGPSGSRRGPGPGQRISFTTRDGDARISVNTFSGDVRLLRK